MRRTKPRFGVQLFVRRGRLTSRSALEPNRTGSPRVTPDQINRAVGRRLATRRRELGLSLSQVAQRCGVSLQQVHRYERGQTPMTAPMLVQLSRCLDVPVVYFFEELEAAR